MSSARIHIRNLLFNWGGHASTLLVMFFLSPYIVGKLDAISYGIWSLLTVLTGYMGLFDLGVRASVGRHIALYLGKEDKKGVDETIRAGFGFFSLVGGMILVAGILLAWKFPQFFRNVPEEHYSMIRLLLPIMVINIWLTAVGAIYSSLLAAHERFDIARSVDFGMLAIRTAGTVWALHVGWGLWGLAGSVITANFFAVIGNYVCARIYHPGLRSWPPLYNKRRLKELLDYGLAASISSAAVKIIGKTDLVIVGAVLAVASVREYNVGYVVPSYSATFVVLIGRTLFPSLQKAVAKGKMGEARYIFGRQLRMSLCFGIPVYVGMAIYAESFVRLWMLQDGFDEISVLLSAGVMTILAVANLPLLFIRPSISFLAASGYMRYNALIAIIEAFCNLGFSLFFVMGLGWGLKGIAAGTVVARLLVPSLWIPWYQHKKIGGGKMQLSVLGRAVLSGLLFTGFCLMVAFLWYPTSWLTLLCHIILDVCVWIAIGFPLLAPKELVAKISNRLANMKK
jgi:O-antigen/teichoic acid export membrane protein